MIAWDAEIRNCLAYLAVEKSHARSTQALNQQCLQEFARWAGEPFQKWDQIQTKDLEEFLREISIKRNSATIKKYIVAIKHLFRF